MRELATLRLRNMTEVLSNWNTYVPVMVQLKELTIGAIACFLTPS